MLQGRGYGTRKRFGGSGCAIVEGSDSDMTVEISVVTAPSAASSSSSFSDPVPQRPTNRCFSCNKRVSLTGFKCKCGDVFCSLHRYSDKHNSSFDYKTAGRDAIAKANPVVMARKIDKIWKKKEKTV